MVDLPSKDEVRAEVARDAPDVAALKREVASLNRRLRAHQGGEDLILRAVRECYAEPPDLRITPAPAKSRKKRQETALLHITDTQIGKITKSYSISVANERLMMLANKVSLITEMRRGAAAIDECVVMLGGDIVEGELIFPHQAHQIEQSVFDQSCKESPAILARVLLKLLEIFPNVRVVAVPGNHGRPAPKSAGSHPRTNWDRVAYHITKLALLGPDEDRLKGRLSFRISDDFYAVEKIHDWGVLLIHGHEIGGGFAGFPWYGAATAAWKWIESIPETWDNLYFGHFHQFASAILTHRGFFCGGTTESDNEFAQARMKMGGTPAQRLQFYNADYGIIADHQIFLCAPGDRLPQSRRHEKR